MDPVCLNSWQRGWSILTKTPSSDGRCLLAELLVGGKVSGGAVRPLSIGSHVASSQGSETTALQALHRNILAA